MFSNRRGFLTGIIAGVTAPAIVRPGLLMPIKPSLVPGYTIRQFGVDMRYIFAPDGHKEARRKTVEFLLDTMEIRGLVLHSMPPPVPPGATMVEYIGQVRTIPFYDARWDGAAMRADVFVRDYSAA